MIRTPGSNKFVREDEVKQHTPAMPQTPASQSPSLSLGQGGTPRTPSMPQAPSLLPKFSPDVSGAAKSMMPSQPSLAEPTVEQAPVGNTVRPVGGGSPINLGTGKPVTAQPIQGSPQASNPAQQPQNYQGQAPMQAGSPQAAPTQMQPTDFNQINYSFATQVEGLMGSISQLQAQLGQDDGSQLLIASWYADMEQSLDQAYQQMMQQMQQQMGQEDPAIKAAIQALKEEVSLQRQSIFDELNARGLAQSGILVDVSAKLARGEMSEIQKMTAANLLELKSQMLTAIQNFAQQRAGLMSQAFQARTQALEGSLNRRTGLQQALLGAQTQLVGTIGQWEGERMKYDAAMKQIEADDRMNAARIQGSKDVATIQGGFDMMGRVTSGLFGMATTGMQIQGQKDITGMSIAGDKEITGMRIQGEKEIAGMNIEAEKERWMAQMSQNASLAAMDSNTRIKLAEIQAQNAIAIAEIGSKDQVLGLQMKAASDNMGNVILPLIVAGKLDAAAFREQIGGLPPEVQSMYLPVLDALGGGTPQAGAQTPGSPVVTPGYTPKNPAVDSWAQGKEAEQTAADTKKLQGEIASLQQEVTELEQAINDKTSKLNDPNDWQPKATLAAGIEQDQGRLNELKAKLKEARDKLNAAPKPTVPNTPGTKNPVKTP